MNDAELAAELDELVRQVPGVLGTYPVRPSLLAAVAEAAAVVLHAQPASPVSVTRDAEGVVVRVSVAVSDERPAAETCRAVHDAVMARLGAAAAAGAAAEHGGLADDGAHARDTARVSVEVARIG